MPRFTTPRLDKLEKAISAIGEIANDLPDDAAYPETEEAYWCLKGAMSEAREAAGHIEAFERKEAKVGGG